MNQFETVEGIVLRSVDFQEHQRILTVLTPTEGIMTLCAKGISRHTPRLLNATVAPSRAEFSFRRGKGEIHRILDAFPLCDYLSLRQSLQQLTAAGKVLQAVLHSQFPGTPNALLYALTTSYLQRLSQTPSPNQLATSFQLKLLKLEGLFAWKETRMTFEMFSTAEWEAVGRLVESQKFPMIEETQLALALEEKVTSLFCELLHRNQG